MHPTREIINNILDHLERNKILFSIPFFNVENNVIDFDENKINSNRDLNRLNLFIRYFRQISVRLGDPIRISHDCKLI